VPAWIVCGAGTGGTSATIGRYLRYRGLDTRLCVAEPTGSAFAIGWREDDRDAVATRPTLIEGIGRRSVEPGFLFEIVDAVVEVDDAESIAAAWLLEELLGRRRGGSSGTHFAACLRLAAALRDDGRNGAIVTLLGDLGERYHDTLFDPAWLAARGIDPRPQLAALRATVADDGHLTMPGSSKRRA
jgi:cysteine synthase A